MAKRIRVTFYTGSDEFPAVFPIERAREWVRSRVSGREVVKTATGTIPGKTIDELDDSDLAKWLAAITLKTVDNGDALNVRERDGKWVSIRPERVEAVGAEVEDGDEDDDAWRLPFEVDQPWLH